MKEGVRWHFSFCCGVKFLLKILNFSIWLIHYLKFNLLDLVLMVFSLEITLQHFMGDVFNNQT